MDNLENGEAPDPQEAADVTAASGQSDGIETQATEEAATIDDGAAEAEVEAHPWDTDDRFKGKTPEQMFQIVQEADRYKGQLGQKAKLADQLSQQYGLTTERMEQITREQAENSRQRQIAANPVAAVYDKVQRLEQQLLIKEEETKLTEFLKDKPQYSEFRDEIKEIGFTVGRDKTWDQIADKYFGRAINQGREDAYRQTEVKQKTQATGVSRGDIKPSVTLEDMKNMTAAEIEAVLRTR